MKKLLTMCILAFFGITALSAADKVEGYWKSIDEKTGKVTAAWRIYQKDSKLYGEIITVPEQKDSTLAVDCTGAYKDFPVAGDVSKMTVVNTPFIYGLKMKNPGQWEDGNIIDPKDGKLYKCKITFRPADGKKYKTDMLEMRGEIGMGIGRSQLWIRTNETEIETLRVKG
jgi:uncharacterized protein (DUF2147 family)